METNEPQQPNPEQTVPDSKPKSAHPFSPKQKPAETMHRHSIVTPVEHQVPTLASMAATNLTLKRLVPPRKFLLRFAILVLILTAVAGIAAILFNGLGSYGSKIFSTAGEVAATAFLSLCFTGKTTSRWFSRLQVFGFLCAFVAMAYSILVSWSSYAFVTTTWLLHVFGIVSILAIAIAQVCVLSPMRNHNPLLKKLTFATLTAIIAFSGLAIALTFGGSLLTSDWYIKVVGIALILDVLGTILVPVLKHFSAQMRRAPKVKA